MGDAMIGVVACLLASTSLSGDNLTVVRVEPEARTMASVRAPILLHFDRPVNRTSITNGPALWAFAKWSGTVDGAIEFANDDRTVMLVPDRALSAGEPVSVFLSHDAEGADGVALDVGGYTFQYGTTARSSNPTFTEIDRFLVRSTPTEWTRAYGGIASDLDSDGWLDLTIVNEISADLRVFLNRADGSGLFGPLVEPTYPVGDTASPTEPADFDRDGNVDVCVSNVGASTISILRGSPNGKFGPQQRIGVGATPRGIVPLDVDGDGDLDVVVARVTADPAMVLLTNAGNGVFSGPVFFDAGIADPWGLAAADMNEDGRLDLVIGSRFQEQFSIRFGNGDGTFSAGPTGSIGGPVWMINTGDLNGDGHDDVATVNSSRDTASILFGDGEGNLTPPVLYPADPFPLATDLGDVDGDGDLDWVTSSYAGDWWLYVNDGTGAFSFSGEFASTDSASCALMFDLDNDSDLDLALIDELSDEVILMRSGATEEPLPPPGVPDGIGAGTPLTARRLDSNGARILVTWDDGCSGAADHQLVFGHVADLPEGPGGTYGLAGSRCGLGTSSPFEWSTSPQAVELLWFLVVARDTGETEGAWGGDSLGLERMGPGPAGSSGACGVTAKDPSTGCR